MGLIAGVQAPPGKIMGHAGAFAAPGEPDSRAKIRAWEDAGVVLVNHPEKFGGVMKRLLDEAAGQSRSSVSLVMHPISASPVNFSPVKLLTESEARISHPKTAAPDQEND
jgi:hypothetical protein